MLYMVYSGDAAVFPVKGVVWCLLVKRVCMRGAVSCRDLAKPLRSLLPVCPSRVALKSPPTSTVWLFALALVIHLDRMFVRMS